MIPGAKRISINAGNINWSCCTIALIENKFSTQGAITKLTCYGITVTGATTYAEESGGIVVGNNINPTF
jgi:hypothetical protein